MGAIDKGRNSAEDVTGKAKEAVGRATGDDSMEAEGQQDQAEAGVKKVVEDVKDIFTS